MAKAAPKPKFMTLGKSKFVHTVRTEAYDRKNSECQQVRKYMVAGKIDYKAKGLSPEAALALDGCETCATKLVAESLIPAADKKAKRAEVRDEVLARAKGATKKTAKIKAAQEVTKGDKERKPKKPSMTKSGPRSTASRADGDPTTAKAKMLADFGAEHGWSTTISEDKETGHTVVTAVGGDDEVITAWFIDGKYDINRHAETRVGSWVGKLRGAHACRRQMAGEGRDRVHPEPGKGRSGPRKKADEPDVPEDESPEDARKRVPFSIDDEPLVIIDAIKGRTIKWRNSTSGGIEEAQLPASSVGKVVGKKKKGRDLIQITEHPKTGKRMVNFLVVDGTGEHGEVYGVERTVLLERIVRVVG